MRSDVTIRRAEPPDFEAWFELFEAVASEGRWIGAEAPLHRPWAEKQFRGLLGADTSVLFLAEADGLLLGDLSVEDERGCAELGMMVRAGHRGEGVGSALMDACLAWSTERKAHKIMLHVWPHNEAAIALYRKYGFAVEGRLARHWRRRTGELWDLVPMGLVLDASSPGSPHPDAGVVH